MGDFEKRSQSRRQREKIQTIVLQSIAAAGFLTIALFAPNVLQVLKQLGLEPKARQKESIHRARKNLMRKGLIVFRDGKFILTSLGETEIQRLELLDFKIKKPKRWDGRWRILIFDIPETRRGTREKIRRTLVAIGFRRLQDSVWLYPYPCDDLITLLKTDFKIGKDLLYLIVDSLEGDGAYRGYFNLS